MERANTLCAHLEKKQKGFDRIIEEWQKKCQGISSDLDASQRDTRIQSTEVFKLKNQNDEISEQVTMI